MKQTRLGFHQFLCSCNDELFPPYSVLLMLSLPSTLAVGSHDEISGQSFFFLGATTVRSVWLSLALMSFLIHALAPTST